MSTTKKITDVTTITDIGSSKLLVDNNGSLAKISGENLVKKQYSLVNSDTTLQKGNWLRVAYMKGAHSASGTIGIISLSHVYSKEAPAPCVFMVHSNVSSNVVNGNTHNVRVKTLWEGTSFTKVRVVKDESSTAGFFVDVYCATTPYMPSVSVGSAIGVVPLTPILAPEVTTTNMLEFSLFGGG